MTGLAAFLAARLGEDEAVARTGSHPEWRSDGPYLGWVTGGIAAQFKWTTDAAHAARHDPARVLRQVEAGRTILELHAPAKSLYGGFRPNGKWQQSDEGSRQNCTMCGYDDGWAGVAWPCATVLALAAVHRDHPDYDPA